MSRLRGSSDHRAGRVCFAWQRLPLRVFMIVMAAGGWPAESWGQTDEYRLKAAFVFHFAQFVEWPAVASRPDGATLSICTIGDDPFDGGLESVVEGKLVGTRPIRVRHLKETQDARQCDIVFIGMSASRMSGGLLTALQESPVLTVGEAANFVRQGGIIGFVLEDKKLRFEINIWAAERAKLKISSRLLSLAHDVIGRESRR